MKHGINARTLLLGVLLLCAGWLAFFGDKTPPSSAGSTVSQPVVRRSTLVKLPVPPTVTHPGRVDQASSTLSTLSTLSPRDGLIRSRSRHAVDLFSAQNWTPPPPPPAPMAPPPPPTAPPLPYTYLGKKQEAGHWEVYLARGEMTYIVRQGASLEGNYQIERIEPPSMTLTYRPLGQIQYLPIGE